MRILSDLFANNRAWAAQMTQQDPAFFARLSSQQSPQFLWIGCSDSRVPANQIVGLPPGEMFVHRNVANLVVHTDLNCLSSMQFAVEVLGVKHIIVCGHYGCGGVLAALRDANLGLIDNWLRHVQDVATKHSAELAALTSEAERHQREQRHRQGEALELHEDADAEVHGDHGGHRCRAGDARCGPAPVREDLRAGRSAGEAHRTRDSATVGCLPVAG